MTIPDISKVVEEKWQEYKRLLPEYRESYFVAVLTEMYELGQKSMQPSKECICDRFPISSSTISAMWYCPVHGVMQKTWDKSIQSPIE